MKSISEPSWRRVAISFLNSSLGARIERHLHRIGWAPAFFLAWFADPNVRRFRARLASLEGKYSGKRCFIMGNGPSLNITPLQKLAGDYVWGVNRCYLLFDRIEWRPSFYVAVDTRVVPDNAPEITAQFSALPHTLFFFPLHFRLRRALLSAPNAFWYDQVRLNDTALPHGHFSTNVTSHVRSVRTVTLAAMQLAVHLGFNPIYLIGCDTDYQVPASVEHERGNQDLLVATGDDDIDHFSPDYFGTGKRFHQPYPERMVFGYQQAKEVCDGLGVDVFNATVGGKLEVFPRAEFASLFE